jgi:hypothetical protein
MELISAAEYSRHAGISKAAVSKQIASGRIPVYGPTGERVFPDEPGKKFISAAEADLARAQTRARITFDAVDQPVQSAEPAKSTLTQAKRDAEAYRSELLRLDLEERRGVLVRVTKVEDALAAAGEKIVRIIDQLPMDADDLATAIAKGGVQALRVALKEIARRMCAGIADSLSWAATSRLPKHDRGCRS